MNKLTLLFSACYARFARILVSAQTTFAFAFSIRISDNISDGHFVFATATTAFDLLLLASADALVSRVYCPPLNGSNSMAPMQQVTGQEQDLL